MKLLAAIVVATVSVVAPSAGASAGDGCPAGSVTVESAGGPLCVGEKYVNGAPPEGVEWDHPSICENGYYQGRCAPVPPPAPGLSGPPTPECEHGEFQGGCLPGPAPKPQPLSPEDPPSAEPVGPRRSPAPLGLPVAV